MKVFEPKFLTQIIQSRIDAKSFEEMSDTLINIYGPLPWAFSSPKNPVAGQADVVITKMVQQFDPALRPELPFLGVGLMGYFSEYMKDQISPINPKRNATLENPTGLIDVKTLAFDKVSAGTWQRELDPAKAAIQP